MEPVSSVRRSDSCVTMATSPSLTRGESTVSQNNRSILIDFILSYALIDAHEDAPAFLIRERDNRPCELRTLGQFALIFERLLFAGSGQVFKILLGRKN